MHSKEQRSCTMGQGWRPSLGVWGRLWRDGASKIRLKPLPPGPKLLQASNSRHVPGCDTGFEGATGPKKWAGRSNRTSCATQGSWMELGRV